MPLPSTPVYDRIGQGYTRFRQPDPRWQAHIDRAVAGAGCILNVGAGTGSYEPGPPAQVVAVEPSRVMVDQRPAGAAAVVRASGSALPFADGRFDVVMAILTLHHWDDWRRGLAEVVRMAPRRVILAIDFELHASFWLLDDYLPEVAEVERALRPTLADIAAAMPVTQVIELPLPPDLADGVLGSFWQRPEMYLDHVARENTSPLALANHSHVHVGISRLEAELADGTWEARYGYLRQLEELDLGYRLLISEDR